MSKCVKYQVIFWKKLILYCLILWYQMPYGNLKTVWQTIVKSLKLILKIAKITRSPKYICTLWTDWYELKYIRKIIEKWNLENILHLSNLICLTYIIKLKFIIIERSQDIFTWLIFLNCHIIAEPNGQRYQ